VLGLGVLEGVVDRLLNDVEQRPFGLGVEVGTDLAGLELDRGLAALEPFEVLAQRRVEALRFERERAQLSAACSKPCVSWSLISSSSAISGCIG
jgi:hypothetical protein